MYLNSGEAEARRAGDLDDLLWADLREAFDARRRVPLKHSGPTRTAPGGATGAKRKKAARLVRNVA